MQLRFMEDEAVLFQETKEKLSEMKLRGMLRALEEWQSRGDRDLDPTELLGLLVDAEWTERENRRLTNRRRQARFPLQAAVEDIDYQHPRGLPKAVMRELLTCRWIAARQNVIITGPTGVGKTWLPCALGEKACREGYRVLYTRAPRLFGELFQARADGSYPRLLQKLAKVQLLIIDDLGCAPLDEGERRDLREILEDRYSLASTLVTSQLDPEHWHAFIGDETMADAICDRLVHNAYHLKLSGESMRKKQGMSASNARRPKESVS